MLDLNVPRASIVALIPVATMKTSSATIFSLLFVAGHSSAFLPSISIKKNAPRLSSTTCATLFEDDEEMIPVAKNYIHAKYKQVAASHGHAVANKEDVREVLHSILPPVTPEELEREETAILNSLLSHKQNSADAIDEDDFVESIMRNSYWDSAGDIVVKELMYFDSVSFPLAHSIFGIERGLPMCFCGLSLLFNLLIKSTSLSLVIASLVLQDRKAAAQQR